MYNLFILDPIWVSALAALVAAFAAILYVIFSRKIVKEMQKDREEVKENRMLEYKPIVNVIFDDGSSYFPRRLGFVLKNVGRGPALDLKIECVDERSNRWKLGKEISPIGSLEMISVILNLEKNGEEIASEVLEEREIFIEIDYKSIFGNRFHERIKIPRTVQELLCTRLGRR